MKTLLPFFLLTSLVFACSAESTSSPGAGTGAGTGAAAEETLSTEREVGECGTSMKPLNVGLQDDESPPTSAGPKVTARGEADSVVFLVANGGVDCSGGEIEAKQKPDRVIDVALRYTRAEGKPATTNCFCASSPDVKGTIKNLAPGHYELRVVREKMVSDGVVTEEVITPTSVGVDVGEPQR